MKCNSQRSTVRKGFFAVILLIIILTFGMVTAYAEGQTVEVGIPVEENPELFATRSMPTHGEGKIAVFLIDFPDYRNENPLATVEYYGGLYFSGGISNANVEWDGVTVAGFYEEESYGKLRLSGKVFDWYTAKHERSYYDDRKAELVIEAAEHYIGQGADFSQFDGDGDGVIDAITYHFAGEITEERNTPWYPGRCMHYGGKIGNLQFTTMVQLYERAGDGELIATICHELMHTLGMTDLYSERAEVLGVTDLMGRFNQRTINPYTKILLGWIDTVQLITENTTSIRLDPYGSVGDDVAIVATEFGGFFDEFYIVAYRSYIWGSKQAVIWHVDARLTEDGSAFRYSNLVYTPRPNVHFEDSLSDYPFLEELSADATVHPWLDISASTIQMAFGKDSVLGPNSVPSSDTHDGTFTGIRISNFVTSGQEYLTFDVSFVDDTRPPVVTTNDVDLGLKETVAVDFNEFIYRGANFDQIKVTDLDGNALDATVTLPRCPDYRLEITFYNKTYANGYRIEIPAGALQDTKGNANESVTLATRMGQFISPIGAERLPLPGEYGHRWGNIWFPGKNDVVIVSPLYIDGMPVGAKIEFLRLDLDGNVLHQSIVDNPFYDPNKTPESDWEYILVYGHQTDDGHYIFGLTLMGICDRFFCMDGDGNVVWANDDYFKTGTRFMMESAFAWNNGLGVFISEQGMFHISSQTGEMTAADHIPGDIINLFNGKMLEDVIATNKDYHILRIFNSETLELEVEGTIPCISSNDRDTWTIREATANDDGTIMIFCETFDNYRKVFLLDAELHEVASVELDLASTAGGDQALYWLNDGGFVWMARMETDWHGNNDYLVYRYDRYLNLIWKENVTTAHQTFFYFISDSGELYSVRSKAASEVDDYALYVWQYGDESQYKVQHVHTLTYMEEMPATCKKEGRAEYWYCSSCGGRYSDQGITGIADMNTLTLPMSAHVEKILSANTPTCTRGGLTEGAECTVCGEILVEQQRVGALGHTEKILAASNATCTESGLTQGIVCSVCGLTLLEQQPVPATGHTHETISEVPPTDTNVGYTEGLRCSVCGETLVAPVEIPKKSPDTGIPDDLQNTEIPDDSQDPNTEIPDDSQDPNTEPTKNDFDMRWIFVGVAIGFGFGAGCVCILAFKKKK